MPRGRPKMIGALLPKGGSKTLNTKKRLAAKAAAWDAFSPIMLSGANTQVPTVEYGKKSRSRAKKNMTAPVVVVETAPKTRRKATEAQLAALANARAVRAAKKAGTTVAVAVAAPTTQVKRSRGRPRLTEEQKIINKAARSEKKKIKKD